MNSEVDWFQSLVVWMSLWSPHLPGFSNFVGMTHARRPSRISTSVTKTPQPCLFQNLAFFPAPIIHRRLFLVMTKGYRVQATSIHAIRLQETYRRRSKHTSDQIAFCTFHPILIPQLKLAMFGCASPCAMATCWRLWLPTPLVPC